MQPFYQLNKVFVQKYLLLQTGATQNMRETKETI